MGRRPAWDGELMSSDGYSEAYPSDELEIKTGDECLVTVRATWNGSTWALADGSFLRTIHVVDVRPGQHLRPEARS